MSNYIRPGYTRVTTICSAFAPYHFMRIDPAIIENAGKRGDHIHEIIYDLINFVPVSEKRYWWGEKSLHGYIDSWRLFWEDNKKHKILAQEERLYENDTLVTGQLDLVIEIDGYPVIIDWKTSHKPVANWDIQASGYSMLYKKGEKEDGSKYAHVNEVSRVYFVLLDKSGKRPKILTFDPYYDLFYDAWTFYNRYFKDQQIPWELE